MLWLKKKFQTEVGFQRFSILMQQKNIIHVITVQIWEKIKYGIDLTIVFNSRKSYAPAVTFQVTHT